jgi:hypothetical protein
VEELAHMQMWKIPPLHPVEKYDDRNAIEDSKLVEIKILTTAWNDPVPSALHG